MKKRILQVVSLLAVLSFCLAAGCASSRNKDLKSTSNLYSKSYDEVWKAVKDLLLNDLDCVSEIEDKKSGLIKTGWVHTMDMDGYYKWQIIAKIKKKKNGVYVEMDKVEQVKKTPRQQIGVYAEERMKHQARNTADASTWRTLEVDKAGIEDLHKRLSIKLNR